MCVTHTGDGSSWGLGSRYPWASGIYLPLSGMSVKNTQIGSHQNGWAVGLFYSTSGVLLPFSSAPFASSVKLSFASCLMLGPDLENDLTACLI